MIMCCKIALEPDLYRYTLIIKHYIIHRLLPGILICNIATEYRRVIIIWRGDNKTLLINIYSGFFPCITLNKMAIMAITSKI